jgi:replicative DNA helicase
MSLESLEEYGKDFVDKILHLLLTDKEYLNTIQDAINLEHYENDTQKWIVKKILEYYNKNNTTPDKDWLKLELKKEAVDDKMIEFCKRIGENLVTCYKLNSIDCEYVRDEYRFFCVDKALEQAILTSADLMKYKQYDDIRKIIDNALKLGQDREVGHDYGKDLEERYRIDNKKIIPFPFEEWNERTGGGMRSGNLILLFGLQGGGKSWLSVILSAHVIKLGYKVLFYTLELDETYVGKRYDAKFTQISLNDLSSHKDDIQEVLDSLEGELKIFRLGGKKKRLSYIKSHLRSLERIEGFKPDLMIIDYIDCIKPEVNGKYFDKTDETDDLYTEVRDMGAEFDFPIISPCQVNRSGARDKIVESDKMAGSYNKGMIADISLSLSRDKDDKANNTGRIHWMKNRYGRDGMTDNISIDTSNGAMEILGNYEEESEQGNPRGKSSAARKALGLLTNGF